MSRRNRKLKNAIMVNFQNIVSSGSFILIVFIVTAISFTFSFLPWVSRKFLSMETTMNYEIFENFLVTICVCSVILLFMVLLITRIGMQVGFEKGSKVTEIILTSISKEQLFLAHIISSIMVVVVAMVIIYCPVFTASFINKPEIVLLFRNMNEHVWFIVGHMFAVATEFVLLSVTVASKVKRSEDTGPYLLTFLLPCIISLSYFAFENGMYTGKFAFLNYIPMFSLIPSIGSCINGELSMTTIRTILLSDVAFVAVTFLAGRKVFVKNIAVC